MNHAPTSVLVIDDNDDLTENIVEILDDLGVYVRVAGSGEEALEIFDERRWDLVVTDVRMPGINGIELLAQLKERSPGTPVLVMTGYADRDTRAAAHRSGALAVVHKPLDLEAFIELIERVSAAETPVLIVDDDDALCSNLTDILGEQQGVLPHPAATLELARRLAACVDFHAALIDLRLPDGDGLSLARELERRADGSRRPVIVMTGYPEALEGAEEGVEVLAKPFPVPNLVERLREIV
ncbi:response regulator receiver domain protein (CheY-like) [Plesiocystis pacifica SIR-1]|uniref:Response regulator receiver domain protein (CheY-like) n=1 Tax=Plesiocystis pacifica SIR-1 TaxID=391625 RepID=A6G8T0_9BACT|nr:response regulator [Plesiocystis pacifica]EDM77740.1 response regulator receiver domain protein (CheY-like) [Plesiocystis pacifica SIR-1]